MKNNETGEFELVVGNRQIMSGFFIVVLLFAVGVAMGYFLGQNSPRSARLPSEASAANTSTASGDSRPQPAAPAPVTAPPPTTQPAESQPQPPAETAPQPTTQPVRDPGAAAPTPAPAASEAVAGTYWQVYAVSKTEADVVVRTLGNKGFPATTSPGTKGLTRVIVGPYADRAALGKAKTELEAAGFSSLFKIEIAK